MIEPHKDPAVEAIERRQTRALRVDEEAKVERPRSSTRASSA